MLLQKLFLAKNSNLDKKVLILVAIGVAAINVDETTIRSALQIPVGNFGKDLSQLSDKIKSSLRNRLCEVKMIIIGEISMVSNVLLYHMHLRSIDSFGCSDNKTFAGLSVIAVGDLYQLTPVGGKPVYAEYKNY